MSAPEFVCPLCKSSLVAIHDALLRCTTDGLEYRKENSIWHFIPAVRLARYERFIDEYDMIRKAEGRGSNDADYYVSLPFQDTSKQFEKQWAIRAKSFQSLVKQFIIPMEAERDEPLRILDLGAGNSWLANRLALRANHVTAIDLLLNSYDGLGARVYYETEFTSVQAEFDYLPFRENSFDLSIYNSSLHYSTSYQTTLKEAVRVLKPEGQIVIIDSPLYKNEQSGIQMLSEREVYFLATFGIKSNAMQSKGFLTYSKLEQLADQLSLEIDFITPNYGLAWSMRPFIARIRRTREPATFSLIRAQARSGATPSPRIPP